jgi:cell division protein ZapA
MRQSTRFQVAIAGCSYSLVSDEPEELIVRSTALVEKLLQEIRAKAPQVDSEKALVLAAVQLALDYVKIDLRDKHHQVTINRLVDHITAQLGAVL